MDKRLNKLLKKAQTAYGAGDLKQARQLYDKMLRIDEANVDALYLRGSLLAQQGKYKEALFDLTHAAALHGTSCYIQNNLGGVYQKLGQLEEAAACYRKALTYNPEMVEAHGALGYVLQELGQLPEAEQHYLRALELQPGAAMICHSLGRLYRLDQRLEAAEHYLSQAVQAMPDNPGARLDLGATLIHLGELERAASCFEQVLLQEKGATTATVGLADIREKQGRLEAAEELLAPVLKSDPANIEAVLIHAKVLKGLGRIEEAIACCEPLLTTTEGERRSRLSFALGDFKDIAGDYEAAFSYFEQANRCKGMSFDEPAHKRFIDGLRKAYNRQSLAGRPVATDASGPHPIFIVGMPRSGTSLVEQILASHPQVYGAGESHEINQLVTELPQLVPGAGYPGEIQSSLTSETLNRMRRRYLERVSQKAAGAPYITDKMPFNYLHLGFIAQLFPEAHVVHCVRNALDTCLSCYASDFYGDLAFANDLAVLGRYYRHYRALMEHWKDCLQLPILELEYESLVGDQKDASYALIRFCGLDWDERCLRFYDTDRYVNTLSYRQVRQPIYNRSVGRHKNYLSHLGPLVEALGDLA